MEAAGANGAVLERRSKSWLCLMPGESLVGFSGGPWIAEPNGLGKIAMQFHIAFLSRSLRWLRFFLAKPNGSTSWHCRLEREQQRVTEKTNGERSFCSFPSSSQLFCWQ